MLTVQEKLQIIDRHLRGEAATSLAEEFGVSVRSVFLWCKLFDGSLNSLESKSRAPKRTRRKATPQDEELMLELRTSKKYGYRKIKWHFKRRLNKNFGESTVKRILAKHGLAGWRKKRKIGRKHRQARVPNERVLIDFTEKRIKKGKRTYTFVALDSCTRRMFACAYEHKRVEDAVDFVKRLVKAWGLMKRIQLDNGTQFVYLLKRKYKKRRLRKKTRRKQNKFGAFCKELGVKLKFIPTSSPNKNAEVERVIRTLKDECLNVTLLENFLQLKKEVASFVSFYNEQREHNSLNGETPLNEWRKRKKQGKTQQINSKACKMY